MIIKFVLAVFENGEHIGYWSEGDECDTDQESDASWYDLREDAETALGEIPRKYDVRIYCLMPSPGPSPTRGSEDPISSRLPEFLKADA